MPYFWWSLAQEAPKCEANPPVCWATPETMRLYLDFQREVAALIQTHPFKTVNETVSEWEWGIFTNELLKLEGIKNFDDSLAGQALKIFYTANVRSATALITSAFLFELAGLSTLADNSVGLTILFQDRPIVRDWAKLLEVERNLNQTAYHLGQAGEIARTISDTVALKQLLKSYEGKGLLEGTEGFSSSLRYMDLLKTLASANIAMKSFLAYNSSVLLDSFKEQGLEFSEKRIQQLKEEYRCVRWTLGFKCSTSWKLLTKNLKILANSTKMQGNGSLEMIVDSWNELKSALELLPGGVFANLRGKSSDDYLTDREKALLRDVYGLDTTKMTKDEAYWVLHLSSQMKDQWRRFAKGAEFGWNKMIYVGWGIINRVKSVFNRSAGEILKDIKNEHKLVSSQSETLNYAMVKNLQALSVSRLESELLAVSTENSVLTHQIGELSVAIKQLIDVIGNKEKNLRKTLNNICSYQAANKGNRGCYIP